MFTVGFGPNACSLGVYILAYNLNRIGPIHMGIVPLN